MSQQTFTDPASGRPYTVDPETGQSRWLGETPPAPPVVPPAGPGFQPLGGPSQPKRMGKGKKIALWGGGAFVALLVIGAINSGGDDATTTTTITTEARTSSSAAVKASKPAASKKAASTKQEPAAAKIGSKVRDGKFEFTVTGTSTKKRLGNDMFGDDAQGVFLLMNVTVHNIGDESPLPFT